MWTRRTWLVLGAALLAAPGATRAFDTQGHDVIEALAYRTLLEGGDGQPPRADVLRDLINDGALVAPICYGNEPKPPSRCRDAVSENPLLAWPQPRTSRPDNNYSRQFSQPGQCIHFMGMLADEGTVPLPGTHVPRGLATTAVVRCKNLVDEMMRQIVVEGGAGTRESGYGLYELMHAVTDSFSHAHAERKPGTHQIDYLRVWGPVSGLLVSRLSDYYAESPLQHDAADVRDSAYIRSFAVVKGRPCKELVELPYTVPIACLSEEGDLARQALVEILAVVRDLRRAQLAAPPGPAGKPQDTEPQESRAWKEYTARWFTPVHPCQGAECQARQPAELVESTGLLFGGSATFNPSRTFYDVALNFRLIEWTQQSSPFVFGLDAEAGYRRYYGTPANLGLVGAGLILGLPIDHRSGLGFYPLGARYTYGGPQGGWEIYSQALMYEFHATENVSISLLGPVEVDWRNVRLDWSFGVVVGYTPTRKRVAGGHLSRHPEEIVERHDDEWAPGPLWFGRLKGRETTWSLFLDATPIPQASAPGSSVMGGLAALGARLMWDRNPWGERLATSYGGTLEMGLRNTSPDTSYLTITGAAEVRWNFLGWLGLSIVPVRIEGGPKVRGIAVDDTSTGVHGSPGNQYYLQAGTRVGIALTAGMVEVLVQAPTLAWQASPFDTGEILSLSLGFRVAPTE
jgi:hypothetical protein